MLFLDIGKRFLDFQVWRNKMKFAPGSFLCVRKIPPKSLIKLMMSVIAWGFSMKSEFSHSLIHSTHLRTCLILKNKTVRVVTFTRGNAPMVTPEMRSFGIVYNYASSTIFIQKVPHQVFLICTDLSPHFLIIYFVLYNYYCICKNSSDSTSNYKPAYVYNNHQ